MGYFLHVYLWEHTEWDQTSNFIIPLSINSYRNNKPNTYRYEIINMVNVGLVFKILKTEHAVISQTAIDHMFSDYNHML